METYLGVAFDVYNAQVEANLTRDLIQLLPSIGRSELVVVCATNQIKPTVNALGARYSPAVELANFFLVYQSGESKVALPDNCEDYVERVLVSPESKVRIDPSSKSGYFLPTPGRMAPSSIYNLRPRPNGYAPVDPALIMLWGP